MTVYIICPELSGRGGIETVLNIVIKDLVSKNISVVLYIPSVPQYTEWLTKLKLMPIHIVFGKKHNHVFTLIKMFISANKDSRFLIASTSRISVLGLLIRKLFGKKWLLYHWLHFSLNMNNNYTYLNKCDGILAISSSIAQQLKSFGINSEKIHLIYNPFLNTKDKKIYSESSDKHFVYVGRLEDKQKNVSELFQALGILKNTDLVLDIYGDGKDRLKYKKLCNELEIKNMVKWHGWKDNVWTSIQYRPDALILPSKFEGFPMILLEAMSRGIPCITSDFLGYKDIIIDNINGYHYHLGNSKELAKILKKFNAKKFSNESILNSINEFNQGKYFERFSKAIQIDLDKWR